MICPACAAKQPIVRTLKNVKQALWGDTTCPNCGAELDKFGNMING